MYSPCEAVAVVLRPAPKEMHYEKRIALIDNHIRPSDANTLCILA